MPSLHHLCTPSLHFRQTRLTQGKHGGEVSKQFYDFQGVADRINKVAAGFQVDRCTPRPPVGAPPTQAKPGCSQVAFMAGGGPETGDAAVWIPSTSPGADDVVAYNVGVVDVNGCRSLCTGGGQLCTDATFKMKSHQFRDVAEDDDSQEPEKKELKRMKWMWVSPIDKVAVLLGWKLVYHETWVAFLRGWEELRSAIMIYLQVDIFDYILGITFDAAKLNQRATLAFFARWGRKCYITGVATSTLILTIYRWRLRVPPTIP